MQKMFKRDISPRVDTSKSTARYDTNKVIKRKRICPKIDKYSFYDCSELTSCPTPPRALGFGVCVTPKVFWFFFVSKKEHQKFQLDLYEPFFLTSTTISTVIPATAKHPATMPKIAQPLSPFFASSSLPIFWNFA